MPSFEIVVSAENNRYMQWQAMLFHYSCIRALGRSPTVVVHIDEEPLRPGFRLLQEHGGVLQFAPTLRSVGQVEYPPRNTAVALQFVQTTADFIVLCDADMVFLRPPPFEQLGMTPQTISFDRVTYLNPCDPTCTAEIAQACQADGIAPSILEDPVISGGVPHVIPTHLQSDLSREWLRYIDLFPTIDHPLQPNLPRYSYPKGPHRPWLCTMWAVILAMHRLKLHYVESSWCLTNREGHLPVPRFDLSEHCMIHYCFGGVGFDKRRFRWDLDVTDPEFWNVPPGDATIDGELRQQFRDAGHFFGVIKE
jgi:hypothetical protein